MKINRRFLIVVVLLTICICYIDSNTYFALEVETESTVAESTYNSEQETIAVRDIEIGNYEDVLKVGKTQTLSVTVLPSNATNSTVTYTSSDPSVATVSSSGEIKGIAKGSVTITIQAGLVVKRITINVKVATAAITMNTSYLIVKQNEEYLLNAKVSPADAEQSITYKSTDTSVAAVSDTGRVRGEAVGSTSIVVTNGDITTSVTVIVNENVNTENKNVEVLSTGESETSLTEKEQQLFSLMEQSDTVEIQASDYEYLTKNILKKLQETGGEIIVNGNAYSFTLYGNDIVNVENELATNISFTKKENGYTFILNEGNNLPGKIHLETNDDIDGKYLYLYNDSKSKYQLLKNENVQEALDQAGKYYITDQKISNFSVNVIIIVIVCVILIGLGIGYVIVKKKYWFW